MPSRNWQNRARDVLAAIICLEQDGQQLANPAQGQATTAAHLNQRLVILVLPVGVVSL